MAEFLFQVSNIFTYKSLFPVDGRHLPFGDVDARNNTIDHAGIIDENSDIDDDVNSVDPISSSTSENAVEQNRISSASAMPMDAGTSNISDVLDEELRDASISSSSRGRITGNTSTTVSSVWSDERMDSAISDVIMIAQIEQLRVWALESQIEQNHLDTLLKILRRRLLPDLP